MAGKVPDTHNCKLVTSDKFADHNEVLLISQIPNVKVINLSWRFCEYSLTLDSLYKAIWDSGVIVVCGAANGIGGTSCGDGHGYAYPASYPYTISVSSVGHISPIGYVDPVYGANNWKDVHEEVIGNPGTAHTHNDKVDICAPGYNVLSTQINNSYGGGWGTSFASPIVAGVCALMFSANPCLTPSGVKDILKNTADGIYHIPENEPYIGLLGTGRVNAYEAVKAAQASHSTTLDLYIKDRPEDFGDEQYPYHWQADRTESYDIWVRNQQDGFENQEHQEPEYQSSSSVYVYVRVRNKSCVNATGSEELSLYWTKASSWSSWPQNWDGSQPNIGNQIGKVNLGNLAAGKDTIIEFTWNILNPYIHQNWTSCLLARIEGSAIDLITVHPNRIDNDVFFNNNISLRNVTVIDIVPGFAPPGRIGNIYFPHGKYIFVGNVLPQNENLDIKFSVPDDVSGRSILKEAEVKIIFDDVGWNLLRTKLMNRNDIKVLRDKEILLLADTVLISDVLFPANTRIPIYVGFSFLIEKISGQQHFKYHVRQYLSSDNSLLGGVHFEVNRYERDPFKANAGGDKQINEGESVNISAIPINESATYNWYDLEGNLIYEGSAFSISPEITHKYKLEVITDVDGFKDYDEMEVKVNSFWIDILSPNPATNQVNVSYVADKSSSAYLMLLNQTSTVSNNYIIDTNLSETTINLSTYQNGIYTIVLVCDGVARDAKNLVIQ